MSTKPMYMRTEYQPSCSGVISQLLVLKFLVCLTVNLRNSIVVILRYQKLILSKPAELNGLQKVASHSCSRKSTENTEGLKPALILKCGAGVSAYLLG
jgi:hypothetical protein